MLPRAQLIVVLVAIEFAIVGGMVYSIGGARAGPWFGPRYGPIATLGPHLIEGGPHQTFAVGLHPALTVDIGYADLTILTRNASQFDVAVSKSTDFGYFRATAPFTAHKDGETLRIATTATASWAIGDDRMVTVVVPPETQVTVVNAGDITANGLRAAASFSSNNGLVVVDDFDAPTLHIDTSTNGRISLQHIVATRLEASSTHGRVEGSGLQVRDGRVETGHGSVRLGFTTGTDTLVSADTDGKIRVTGFANATSPATVRASSDSDDNDDSSSQTVRIGSGDGRLDVHSDSGNIDLTQEG